MTDPSFPWADRFAGLTPGTAAFTAQWQALASEAPDALFAAQHDYIGRTHYQPLANHIGAVDGFDVSQHSLTLQDVIWSTAVQNGPGTNIVDLAVQSLGPQANPADPQFDRQLIEAIYAERGRTDGNGTLVHFRSSSADVQAGVANRLAAEERDALQQLQAERR